MSRPLFSVVVPTLGQRTTLYRTLDSILDQPVPAEAIVVADSYEMTPDTLEGLRSVCTGYGVRFLAHDAGYHDIGSPQLELGYRAATGGWVMNCGDDDVYLPDAFLTIRDAIAELERPQPLLFCVTMHPAPHRGNKRPVELWAEKRIEQFNVTGQCFVTPNHKAKLGRWASDWQFIGETVDRFGGHVAWREELIAECF